MKRVVLFVLGVVAIAPCARAQTPDEAIERALTPAPRQMKEGATVIKWKADNTYDTLRKGTNKLVCYDRSGDPGQQPFAVQCTSLANLDRVAQNRKFEAIADRPARQAAIDAAIPDSSRSPCSAPVSPTSIASPRIASSRRSPTGPRGRRQSMRRKKTARASNRNSVRCG
jgi:hypothetical protein